MEATETSSRTVRQLMWIYSLQEHLWSLQVTRSSTETVKMRSGGDSGVTGTKSVLNMLR